VIRPSLVYRRRPVGGRKGISLIELMVTIVLLGIGLVGVSSMFVVGYRTQLHAHFASVATDLAARKLEQMKSAGYNGISETTFAPEFAVPELPSGSGTIAYAPYPESTSTNQYLVQVVVTWGGGPGAAGRVVLSSVISNHS
jgi:prepilin-type N-terminal cleavage/methylation domain-containing protein